MAAAPAAFVEAETDRVDDRIIRSDIDIMPRLHMTERPPENNVLEILGIRDERILLGHTLN